MDESAFEQNDLRKALTFCGDPFKTIELFQSANGIALPSLKPALPLLDIHNVSRLDFHSSLLEVLRTKLIQQINEFDTKFDADVREHKLKELLSQSFGMVRLKQIQPVVMTLLKNMKQIDEKYLRVIVRDKELYAACDFKVKRQIWVNNQILFGDEVSPELSQYIRDKDKIIYDHLNLENLFFKIPPKIRRQTEVIRKLTQMIGTSVQLYDMILQFLRTLFLRTKNIHYCTLRSEILMALHDLDVREIITLDPCHTFIWCMDACIRENEINLHRSREIQAFIDTMKRKNDQILGDLSMTLCDPYAINFMASSIIKILYHLSNTEGLPRNNSTLTLLIRMLSLGLSAWHMIDAQIFKEPKFDTKIVNKFLPALMSLIVDDQTRHFQSKLTVEERAVISIEPEGSIPTIIGFYIQQNPIASVLVMYYALHIAKHMDRDGLIRVLPILSNCIDGMAYEDPFLHTFVSSIILMTDHFKHEEFRAAVFDGFLFLGLDRLNVSQQIMKLLWHVHENIHKIRLGALMKAIEPEYTDEMYNALVATIEAASEVNEL